MNEKGYGYKLSREWFDWCFENPSKARPSHTAIYFWMIELCNRLGWKDEFGIPTLHSMEATGISSKNTYYKSFHDLDEWGFIKIIEKAKNQNTPNVISIIGVLKIKSAVVPANIPANKSALDSAMIQQKDSTGNIDKQENNQQLNKKQRRGKFTPPQLYQVQEFINSNGLENVNAEKFFYHYEAFDWVVNGKKIKNWEAKARKWNAEDKNNLKNKKLNSNGNEQEQRVNGQTVTSATKTMQGFTE